MWLRLFLLIAALVAEEARFVHSKSVAVNFTDRVEVEFSFPSPEQREKMCVELEIPEEKRMLEKVAFATGPMKFDSNQYGSKEADPIGDGNCLSGAFSMAVSGRQSNYATLQKYLAKEAAAIFPGLKAANDKYKGYDLEKYLDEEGIGEGKHIGEGGYLLLAERLNVNLFIMNTVDETRPFWEYIIQQEEASAVFNRDLVRTSITSRPAIALRCTGHHWRLITDLFPSDKPNLPNLWKSVKLLLVKEKAWKPSGVMVLNPELATVNSMRKRMRAIFPLMKSDPNKIVFSYRATDEEWKVMDDVDTSLIDAPYHFQQESTHELKYRYDGDE